MKRVLVAALVWFVAFGPPSLEGLRLSWPVVLEPAPPATKATAAVYVKAARSPTPAAVRVALDTLNRQGIDATDFDEGTTDASGETPEQYKAPLEAARAAGLPALVVLEGQKVLRVVKAPTATAQILEAVK